MWTCPKCDVEATDGRRICRKCGSIITEIPPEQAASTPIDAEIIAEEGDRPATDDVRDPSDESALVSTTSSDEGDWTCPKCPAYGTIVTSQLLAN